MQIGQASSNDPSWITVTSGNSGTGNGTVNYSISGNTGISLRTGTMTIAGEPFTVNQSGTSCTYSISSTSKTFTSTGGTGSVNTITSSGCSWTATNNDSWLTITSGSSGSGNGVVSYSVSKNEDKDSRTGQLSIAGHTFNVIQQGAEITDIVAPTATVDFPSCDTYQFQVFEISGTASDDNSGVALVELQVTDGTWYVDENQNFTRTPTWITVSGTTPWSFNTSDVNWTAGLEYTIYVRATDKVGNKSSTSTKTCAFTFVNFVSDTSLTINLSAQRILQRNTLDVSGKLTPLPDSGAEYVWP